MPTPRDTTLTLDELYNSYTPMSLTEAEWRVLAPDIGNLVRATSPSGYWRARDLLSTACRFVSLASPAGGLLIVDEAFTFANVERHRSLAGAAGAAGATPVRPVRPVRRRTRWPTTGAGSARCSRSTSAFSKHESRKA